MKRPPCVCLFLCYNGLLVVAHSECILGDGVTAAAEANIGTGGDKK